MRATSGSGKNCMDDDSSSSSVVFVGSSDTRRGLEWGDCDDIFTAPGTLFQDCLAVTFGGGGSMDFSSPKHPVRRSSLRRRGI